MSNNKPFVRKIIYIALIGILLIPLSFISRPETRDETGKIADAGGQLSQLREEHDLSQAKMSDIDPASETMKLASLGLRGVAVNMLWMQAMEHKKKENYDQLASTLQALTKIQPSFVKVWEYQAHNLAYNVSMEFDDYEYRYQWVKKGIGFLKQGIAYNKRDHRVTDNLGFFTGNKIGKSDEKLSFRRMFRVDEDFWTDMSDYIDPDSYRSNHTPYGHDHWKMAYQWYDYSRTLVEEKSCPQRRGDLMFYMHRPSQVRNQAMGLMEDHEPSEAIREIWERSVGEWMDYGNQKISNTLGVTVTLEEIAKNQARVQQLRDELDAYQPADGEEGSTIKDIRKEMQNDMMSEAKVPEEEMALLELPLDELTDEERQRVSNLREMIDMMDQNLDQKLALETSTENRMEANKKVVEILQLKAKIKTINKDAGTVNYNYWRVRNASEAEELTKEAHRALYDARQMWRQSIYDDEYDFDYKTKKRTITKRGAISLYMDAFAKWKEVYAKHPDLEEGVFTSDLIERALDFKKMLATTNREWPDDFPLQDLIDRRAEGGNEDGLPTTDDLEELRSGRSDDSADDEDEEMDEDSEPGESTTDPAEVTEADESETKVEEKKAPESETVEAEEKVEAEAEPTEEKIEAEPVGAGK